MVVFPNIEMYVEVISGYKDIFGKSIFWGGTTPLIKMSDYDTKFMSSLGEQLFLSSRAMTDRQASMVDRVLSTYAPQLAVHCIGQPDHKHYRLGVRTIDRRNSLSLDPEHNKLQLRFPYDDRIVSILKDFAKTSQGKVVWNKDALCWEFACTEYNLSWAVTIAQANSIKVDSECQAFFDEIVAVGENPHKIELVYTNDGFSISNIPNSMKEYIDSTVGFNDLYSLVDMSGALAYTIHDDILKPMTEELGETFMNLCSKRTIGVPTKTNLSEIIEWAIVVDRLPLCIYAPTHSKPKLGCLPDYFKEDEIHIVTLSDRVTLPFVVEPQIKVIYSTQIIPEWAERLPLLISQVNLMHGTTRRAFVEVPEKLVYHCQQLPR